MSSQPRPGGRRWLFGATGVAVAAGLGVLVAVALGRAGLPEPAVAEGEPVVDAWRLLLAAAFGVGAVVLALLGTALVGGVRRQRGTVGAAGESAPSTPSTPSTPSADTRLEFVYTIIPLVLAAAVFAIGLRTTARQELDRPADLSIEVTAFQWGWQYRYPDGRTVLGTAQAPPELVVPVGRDVRLELHANDVQHSFFVPAFLIKRDLIPGRTNELVLRAEQEGRFLGHCAEFCGLDHARMNFTVQVLPGAEFERWLADTARAST